MEFRHFCDADYDAVCDFLIALNRKDKRHINWNWARFEWMYEHPEFDKSARDAIGLWFDRGAVVGAAIYDMYFGEAFCGVLPQFSALYPEVLRYAYDAQKDDSGLAIAIADGSEAEIAQAKALGFLPIEQTETILRVDLAQPPAGTLADGLRFASLDPVRDADAIGWLFWQGFDHGEDREAYERSEKTVPNVRRHFDPRLFVTAANEAGEPVALCGVWYLAGTDYAYVEPVCTIPAYRKRGVGRAVVCEALNRARALGAKQAYVISDQTFYEKLGFHRSHVFRFYRKS